jgi:hypothetical protein
MKLPYLHTSLYGILTKEEQNWHPTVRTMSLVLTYQSLSIVTHKTTKVTC